MNTSKKLFIIGMILLISSQIGAFNLEQHMYLGAADKSIWQDFDPGFGEYLNFNWPPGELRDTLKLLTMKFYLIGLTLPDLFLPERQTACRSM